MTAADAVAVDSIALLTHALHYALGTAQRVTEPMLGQPTPCEGWNLGMLLRHVNDSLDALYDGISAGAVAVTAAPEVPDLLGTFRGRACRLLRVCVTECRPDSVSVADRPLPTATLAGTGALEVAVHGWDIAQASGHPQPVPAGLAVGLLRVAPLVVTDATRGALFAAPVATTSPSPSDRLVALLGRDPAS